MPRIQGAAITLIAVTGLALAQAPEVKISPELRNLESQAQVDVIVQYRQTPTETNHRRVLARGGELKHDLPIIRGAHYSIPSSELESLAQDPNVESISPDRTVFSTANSIYTGSPDFGWRTVGADLATSVLGVDGTGVGIALIDSGINDNTDLTDAQQHSRIVYKASLITGSSPADRFGHGTHVAGILAGNGKKSSGTGTTYLVRGIAPNANIVSLKALGDKGVSTDSVVIAAIQQAILLKNKYNIRVINLSLGRPVTTSYLTDPLCIAVQKAWQAGIVVVVAAGNNGRDNSQGTNGYGTISAPGNSPYVITVGAMNTVGTSTPADDKIASYSSKGPTSIDHIVKPDLVAPGNRIVSLNQGGSFFDLTYPSNQVAKSVYETTSGQSTADYFLLSGTSMAAPMVSGAAALMIQKDPTLTPDEVKARLMKTASKFAPGFSSATDPVTGATYVDEYDIFTIGAGFLNIPAALENTDLLLAPALSPTAKYDSVSHQTSLVMGSSVLLGTNAIWGTSVSWGSRAIWGSMAIWGTSVFNGDIDSVWGNATFVNGANAIWGTHAVWAAGLDMSEATTIAIHGDN
jgi:serine protease AprX